jgi:hypothetical protein
LQAAEASEDIFKMFYAAMYALKGREERRNMMALQQISESDLGGEELPKALEQMHIAVQIVMCTTFQT